MSGRTPLETFWFMKILLYNPDNGVTANFMPHLWMFLLQALTPPGHEVFLIDGNTQPMSDAELVRFALERKIGLVGIGAMTRMIAKAYRVADALRAAGVPVVMGGPHVTEVPDEALGRDGGPRHADAIALGEADETWPRIVTDAANGRLQEVYKPVDAFGQERKPNLDNYPAIPWQSLDLAQFNRIPGFVRSFMHHHRYHWETFHIIPIESGRGCPYGCEFCTVTGFFGDSIRFRSNQSIVGELLRLKERARGSRGNIAVFFVDDNFAINVKRTKSLLKDIIAAGAELNWVAQISANLLRDEELLDLIADSGGKWIFIGMESLDPANLASVKKSFNKPADYASVLEGLARRNVYAITSFIFGLDNDTPGVAARTLATIREWPPVLPVFGQITPFPATPLYDRLLKEGRLTRPKHWLEFAPFHMAHTPLKMTIPEVQEEVRSAWLNSYSPAATARALDAIADEPVPYKINHLVSRIFFRGIYFPPRGVWAWLKVIAQNRGSILRILRESFTQWHGTAEAAKHRRAGEASPLPSESGSD
ncbi:MAG: B12-binding domain-containing radical SAM protein [Acidobacteriia bacterium]|nr:B12-binding domain-containing radical SAM protein [Terriglobia bacterium]